MPRKRRVTDEAILSACDSELDQVASDGGDLADQREQALDYYLGDMDAYLPHEDDRSSAVSREVLDAVEWVLPSLLKIYTDAENALTFKPVGPSDVAMAKQETEVVRNVFYEQNDGFLNLYTFCKDALLSKTGVWKIYWEDGEWEREDYKNLTAEDLAALLYTPDFEYEIIEGNANPDGTYDIALNCQRKMGSVCIESIPPEEFGVSAWSRSSNVKKSPFVFHAAPKTKASLIGDGWDRKLVESLPCDTVESQVTLARRNLHPEEQWDDVDTTGGREIVWVTECYIRMDRNDDGIEELLQVTMARGVGGTSSSKLMSVEEVDRIPFVTATPIIRTHTFYGLSVADMLTDIQDQRTALVRGMFDAVYLANNPRTAVNEAVNLDDMLVSRPGGVVRTEGLTPPGNHFAPINTSPPPPQAFDLLGVLDRMKQHRTGVGDQVMGLDADALASVNLGVAMQAYEASRMRIELMARIIAETGLKQAFMDIHELLCKHGDKRSMELTEGQWIKVNPSEWKLRTNVRVNVGLGNVSRERLIMTAQAMLETQIKLLQTGLPVVNPLNIYKTLTDLADAYGKSPEMYFTDPRQVPPPQPQPDPNMMLVQIEQQKLQLEAQKLQVESAIKAKELEAKLQDSAMKREVEQLKAQASLAKQAIDEGSQTANARTAQIEAQIAAKEAMWNKRNDELRLELDRYKADLDSLTKLQVKMMDVEQKQAQQRNEMVAMRATMVRNEANQTSDKR